MEHERAIPAIFKSQAGMKRERNSARHLGSPDAVDPAEYTPFFSYRAARNGGASGASLHCEAAELERIAQAAGTPVYAYSRASIEAAYRRLDRAFRGVPHSLCYAMKANSNLSVVRVLARLGSRFDIVSGGELDRLRRLGVGGDRIVFSGVGKSREEIRRAIEYPGKGSAARRGILLFNVESAAEFEILHEEAERHMKAGGRRVSLAIRVNPDVLAGGHPHISTGHHHHKFGMDWAEARRLFLAQRASRWIAWKGISAHIGSQILSAAPYRRALARLASYVRELVREGIRLEFLDIGGGLGIRYTRERALDPGDYAKALMSIAKPLGCHLLLEPGRTLVGPAGVLLTRVIYVKENRGKKFVIVDAAMNDLIRPVLYGAVHPTTKARRPAGPGARKENVDIVGPVCESGDYLARNWPLEPVEAGDLLVIWAAGAYAFVQSSNYNARPRPAEVLVEGKNFRIVRARQTYDDLVRGER